jgi:hypothetical protein
MRCRNSFVPLQITVPIWYFDGGKIFGTFKLRPRQPQAASHHSSLPATILITRRTCRTSQ